MLPERIENSRKILQSCSAFEDQFYRYPRLALRPSSHLGGAQQTFSAKLPFFRRCRPDIRRFGDFGVKSRSLHEVAVATPIKGKLQRDIGARCHKSSATSASGESFRQCAGALRLGLIDRSPCVTTTKLYHCGVIEWREGDITGLGNSRSCILVEIPAMSFVENVARRDHANVSCSIASCAVRFAGASNRHLPGHDPKRVACDSEWRRGRRSTLLGGREIGGAHRVHLRSEHTPLATVD